MCKCVICTIGLYMTKCVLLPKISLTLVLCCKGCIICTNHNYMICLGRVLTYHSKLKSYNEGSALYFITHPYLPTQQEALGE